MQTYAQEILTGAFIRTASMTDEVLTLATDRGIVEAVVSSNYTTAKFDLDNASALDGTTVLDVDAVRNDFVDSDEWQEGTAVLTILTDSGAFTFTARGMVGYVEEDGKDSEFWIAFWADFD